jgi:GGDEF domain-containing protein
LLIESDDHNTDDGVEVIVQPLADRPPLSSSDARLLNVALNCYLQALRAIAGCVADICPPLGTPYRMRLLRDMRRLGFGPRPETLEGSRSGLERDLAEFVERWNSHQAEGVRAASELLAVLSAETRPASGQANPEAALLKDSAEQLRLSASLDDTSDLRLLVAQQAAGLEAVARRLERGGRPPANEKLADCVRQLEAWLLAGNAPTALDPATGLFTRNEIERRLYQVNGFHHPFCLLRFDCQMKMEAAGATLSETARESLLARLGEMLAEQVRPRDYVARWSNDSFAVVMEAPGPIALSRGPEIARWLSDSYALRQGPAEDKVAVQVKATVVVPEPDEDADSLINRLEATAVAVLVPVPA